jgi:hypothetical protein
MAAIAPGIYVGNENVALAGRSICDLLVNSVRTSMRQGKANTAAESVKVGGACHHIKHLLLAFPSPGSTTVEF